MNLSTVTMFNRTKNIFVSKELADQLKIIIKLKMRIKTNKPKNQLINNQKQNVWFICMLDKRKEQDHGGKNRPIYKNKKRFAFNT